MSNRSTEQYMKLIIAFLVAVIMIVIILHPLFLLAIVLIGIPLLLATLIGMMLFGIFRWIVYGGARQRRSYYDGR
jgi:hypothetical protein